MNLCNGEMMFIFVVTNLMGNLIPLIMKIFQSIISSEIGVLDFIMFSKDNKANLSSLLGYYAETTFLNDSPYEAELFATSTEFSESSK